MKTNTIQVIITVAAIALIAGLAGVEVTGNALAGASVGLSYLVVAGLVAMTVSDYGSGPKAYFKAPLVTGHFKQTGPVSAPQSNPGEKTRVAA